MNDHIFNKQYGVIIIGQYGSRPVTTGIKGGMAASVAAQVMSISESLTSWAGGIRRRAMVMMEVGKSSRRKVKRQAAAGRHIRHRHKPVKSKSPTSNRAVESWRASLARNAGRKQIK